MIETFYSYSLFASWVQLLFFSCILFMGKVPDGSYTSYIRSRKLLGVAFFVFGTEIFIHWLFDFRSWNTQIASATNFTCFYLGAILFGMSFISLLDRHYINRRQIRNDFSKYALLVTLSWTAAFAFGKFTGHLLLIGVAILFAADTCRIIYRFFQAYHKAIADIENFYSDDVARFIHWLYRSTFGVSFFGLICAVMAFAPKWAIAIYMSLGLLLFIYIFVSFQNYMMDFREVNSIVNSDMDKMETLPSTANDVTDSEANKNKRAPDFTDNLETWVVKKKFKKPGLTLDQLAAELGTNRSYLSTYINSDLHTTFSDWICKLRLEEAKQMLANTDIPITIIMQELGFSSLPYFSSIFSKKEGLSPGKWRKLHSDKVRL